MSSTARIETIRCSRPTLTSAAVKRAVKRAHRSSYCLSGKAALRCRTGKTAVGTARVAVSGRRTISIQAQSEGGSALTEKARAGGVLAGEEVPRTREEAWEEIVEMFRLRGDSNYDPNVTQIQHALQTATLALRESAPEALVVGGLLHDYGHLMLDEHSEAAEGFLQEDLQHEEVCQEWLEQRFSEAVYLPIKHHVSAKRYLCNKRDGYWAALSDASRRSLELQGGVFTEEEAEAFFAIEGAEGAVQIRLWDDRAKTKGARTFPLEYFKDMVMSQLTLPQR